VKLPGAPSELAALQGGIAHLETELLALRAAAAPVPTDVFLASLKAATAAAPKVSFAPVGPKGGRPGIVAVTDKDSLSSSKPSDSDEATHDADLKEHGWGTRPVDPMRFKTTLRKLVKSTPPAVKFVNGGPVDGFLGLSFIEHATECGSRSITSWFNALERQLREENHPGLRMREFYELRSRQFSAQLLVQNASAVEAALSGSCLALDEMGRRLFALTQVITGAMKWDAAEFVLAVGSVKPPSSHVPYTHLTGMAKDMKRQAKAAAILRDGPGGSGKKDKKPDA
jgi:hypothetical protein